jgi:hypothetical protein
LARANQKKEIRRELRMFNLETIAEIHKPQQDRAFTGTLLTGHYDQRFHSDLMAKSSIYRRLPEDEKKQYVQALAINQAQHDHFSQQLNASSSETVEHGRFR